MILNIETQTITRAPRRKADPLLAPHVRTGWTLFYRRHDGRAGTFVTGADTERLAQRRAFAWLFTLREDFTPAIGCEWGSERCHRAAGMMIKGCGDDCYTPICAEHVRWLQNWMESQKPAACGSCRQPFAEFTGHYSLAPT